MTTSAIALLGIAFATALGQARPPNIVVIVSDDMGYADIGIHGSKDIPTPNIDALAAGGIRFTDAYVSGPYCSPTRAGLMTGRYPQRFGHEFNPDGSLSDNAGLPLSETTLADRLKAAGYRTALFGKWHLGSAERFHPMARGFDEFFGFLAGQHSYVDPQPTGPNPLLDGRAPVHETTYLTDTLTARAVDFIQRNRSRPFFLYLAYNAVHVPMQATDKYLARFTGIADTQRRTYAAMLSAMDDGIGRTMAALRGAGLDENTLVVFFNDNGGPTMQGTTINGSRNAPLRGSKRQTWEGGIRVPFVIRWKGHLAEGKTYRRPIIQLDVLPTVLAAAGVSPQPPWKLDGVNMALRAGDWKLVKTSDGPLGSDPSVLSDLSGAGLYNLAQDIGETKNVAAAHPDKVKALADAWQRWNKELAKPLWAPREAAAPRGRRPDAASRSSHSPSHRG
jgi:arylsulfatase A-like enzyme